MQPQKMFIWKGMVGRGSWTRRANCVPAAAVAVSQEFGSVGRNAFWASSLRLGAGGVEGGGGGR